MDRPPVAWILSDAPYAGGAERYLEFLLRAAGPARLALVAVENPGGGTCFRIRIPLQALKEDAAA